MEKRIVFLNALPLNSIQLKKFTVSCSRDIDIKELIETSKKYINYIRHESTIKALNELLKIDLKPSSELYNYTIGDVLVIVTLKRPVRGQEVEVKIEDLDVVVCMVE